MSSVAFGSGETVYLRRPHDGDVRLFAEWMGDQRIIGSLPEAWRFSNGKSKMEFLEGMNRDGTDIVCTIVKTDSNAPIGVVSLRGISWEDKSADFEIFIGKVFEHGNGYGSDAAKAMLAYAFQTIMLNRVSSSVLDINAQAIGLHRRCGFQEEGRSRRVKLIDRKWCDRIHFAILRDEWLKRG